VTVYYEGVAGQECPEKPLHEGVSYPSPSVALFGDPAGVKDSGVGSGEEDPSVGALTFPGPFGVHNVSCTLPSAEGEVSGAIVAAALSSSPAVGLILDRKRNDPCNRARGRRSGQASVRGRADSSVGGQLPAQRSQEWAGELKEGARSPESCAFTGPIPRAVGNTCHAYLLTARQSVCLAVCEVRRRG
jgi:hypothetical protein